MVKLILLIGVVVVLGAIGLTLWRGSQGVGTQAPVTYQYSRFDHAALATWLGSPAGAVQQVQVGPQGCSIVVAGLNDQQTQRLEAWAIAIGCTGR